MSRLIVVLALVISFSALAFADDPGQPDSVIIGLTAVEPGVPSIMLPVYVVTDDPVVSFTLPLEWVSTDGQINLSGAFYFNTVLDWDEASDTLNMDRSHLIMIGTSDTGGDPNPALNTGYQRELLALLRIVIHAGAEEQFMQINSTFDQDFGPPTFWLDDGQNLQPIVVPGGVFFQSVDVDISPDLPANFALSQNYPNPFNMTTEIAFALSGKGDVTLDVYDVLGRKIRTLISGNLDAGFYSIAWDGRNESGETLSSGMYFYSLQAGSQNITRKMILLK